MSAGKIVHTGFKKLEGTLVMTLPVDFYSIQRNPGRHWSQRWILSRSPT